MSRDVDIEFLGCFDTVASCGAIFPRVLPFSTYNGKTRVFRHALALDERRAKFRQETWHYSLPQKTFSLIDYGLGVLKYPARVAQKHVFERLKLPFIRKSETKNEEEEFRLTMERYALEDDVESSRPVDIKEVSVLTSRPLCEVPYPISVSLCGVRCGSLVITVVRADTLCVSAALMTP
jgi:uncharacterized protein (DUF2235 family)